MATLTLTLTGLSTETLTALATRAAECKAVSLEAYVQELIERDIQTRLQPASTNIEEHPLAKVAGSMSGETWCEWMNELEQRHQKSLQEVSS